MINFKQFFEKLENVETVAVLPGAFKPPTKGHFEAFNNLLQGADKGIVFIGKNDRDGITQDMAYQIWSIYKTYIPKPVEIIKSNRTPVESTYNLAIEHNNVNFIVGVGPEFDENGIIKHDSRYDSFRKNPQKYPHVEVIDIPESGEGVRGSSTREKMLSNDPSAADYFIPSIVKETDRERIKTILGIA